MWDEWSNRLALSVQPWDRGCRVGPDWLLNADCASGASPQASEPLGEALAVVLATELKSRLESGHLPGGHVHRTPLARVTNWSERAPTDHPVGHLC